MMNSQDNESMVLPALRATMGDWTYYISFMNMKDIADRISKLQLLYTSKTLHNLIQRQLKKGRSKEISDYLLTQPQRFFNSLVIGTYGGDPQWSEMLIKSRYVDRPELPESMAGSIGLLTLSGTERLFAIDGQHRVEGIRRALTSNSDLENDEVPIIFVRGIIGNRRSKDPEGFERTRRLFTTLNKYGVKVSKKDIIALDEDDSMAIITRQLVERYPLFSGNKTSINAATSLPKSDKTSFTSINSLYDGLNIFFKTGSNVSWSNYKKIHPGYDVVETFYNDSTELWDYFCDSFSPLQEIRASISSEDIVRRYRNENGGHLLFRPIGLLMLLKTVRYLMSTLSLEEAVERISLVEMNLDNDPWAHLIWNPLNQKMLTQSANRKAAEKLMLYSVGGDLAVYRSDKEMLQQEIAAIQGKEFEDVNLPQYYVSNT